MDVLWPKEKLHKIFSKDSLQITSYAHASGDGILATPRCCRLCGGDAGLRSINEMYLWEGVEERYDQLLYDCFGVRVSPRDCMICERCVRQLRNTQRFRALVNAAFAEPPSDYSTKSHTIIAKSFTRLRSKGDIKKINCETAFNNRISTIDNPRKRREFRRERRSINNIGVKRMNIACTVCNQKYPMIVPFDGWKEFVCSRCKKNIRQRTSECRQCNVDKRSNMMHAKNDLRGKSRLRTLPKQASVSKTESVKSRLHSKYQCSQCKKSYVVAQHLAQHVSSVHGNTLDCLCPVCGKDLRSRELLAKHMRTHTGQPVYQCDICLRTFKGKRSFQTHYLTHEKYT